jgi:hypothetical protein
MKLYLSGAIATEPDFTALFKKDQIRLEGLGYEVVNPVEVLACRDDRDEYVSPARCLETDQASKLGDLHSWQCYMKYDLMAMLKCDGVAMLNNHLQSKGAMLEGYLAMQVGMPIKTVRQWVALSVRENLSNSTRMVRIPRDSHQA